VGYTCKVMLAFSLELGTHYPCSLTLSTAREHECHFWHPCSLADISRSALLS